ncbi:MAG: TonB family protein [Burkholderiaceae bacterium]|nr:TonB family protein [Burkholderiaceae bacterium]
MSFPMRNKTLSYAVLVSVLIHGILMFVRFVPPSAFHIVPPDTSLEVVLVNARGKNAPLKPGALAQANLDGGGAMEKGRPKSPLPDTGRFSDGDVLASSERRVASLQNEQKQLAARLKEELGSIPQPKEKPSEKDSADASVKQQAASQETIAGRAAAIDRNIETQGSQPKKIHITPRTREVGYAMYYKAIQRKIEGVGTLNFPQRNGRKLYGELTVYIPVAPDGSLYDKEGGPRVEQSSGSRALDNAALRIVRLSAPFGPFPRKMRMEVNEVWVIVTRFRFTREDALKTESGG